MGSALMYIGRAESWQMGVGKSHDENEGNNRNSAINERQREAGVSYEDKE